MKMKGSTRWKRNKEQDENEMECRMKIIWRIALQDKMKWLHAKIEIEYNNWWK